MYTYMYIYIYIYIYIYVYIINMEYVWCVLFVSLWIHLIYFSVRKKTKKRERKILYTMIK